MIYLAYIFAIIAIYFFINWIMVDEEKEKVLLLRDDLRAKQKKNNFIVLLKGLVPLNKILLKTVFKKYGENFNNSLIILKWNIKTEEFFSFKIFGAITFFLLFFLFGVSSPGMLAFSGLIGFLLPDIIVNSKLRKLKEEIVRLMPEIVDLLALCVGAGLNFVMAMKWVVEKSKGGPLIDQFKTVLEEVNVGKSRMEALRNMSLRLQLPDVTSFCRILIQADRLGTPVEEAFQIVSDDMRMRRFHRGERQAIKAPMKMLIPLIFCILPVIMIIIGGPILLRFMGGGLIPK